MRRSWPRLSGRRRDGTRPDRRPRVAEVARVPEARAGRVRGRRGGSVELEQTYTVEVSGKRFDVKVIGPPLAAGGAAQRRRASRRSCRGRKPPRRTERAGRRWRRGRRDALTSPIQGTVLKVAVEQGAAVEEGALIAVIEAMKMENEITAHKSGTVAELPIAVGASVATGRHAGRDQRRVATAAGSRAGPLGDRRASFAASRRLWTSASGFFWLDSSCCLERLTQITGILLLQAWLDVVVVARGDVHPAPLAADPALALGEMGRVGLVGADLLRGDDEVEVQRHVAPGLAQELVVDVRDQPDLVLLGDLRKLRVGLLERQPALDRVGQEARARDGSSGQPSFFAICTAVRRSTSAYSS